MEKELIEAAYLISEYCRDTECRKCVFRESLCHSRNFIPADWTLPGRYSETESPELSLLDYQKLRLSVAVSNASFTNSSVAFGILNHEKRIMELLEKK